MRNQRLVVVLVVGGILVLLAILLLIGVLRGDDSRDPNGVNSHSVVG